MTERTRTEIERVADEAALELQRRGGSLIECIDEWRCTFEEEKRVRAPEGNPMDQILEAGRVGARLWNMKDDDPELEAVDAEHDRLMEAVRAGPYDTMLVMVATKLTLGSAYEVNSGNPELIARCRELAGLLGADVIERGSSWPIPGGTSIVLRPATKAMA